MEKGASARRNRWWPFLVVLLLGTIVAAGCGNGSGGGAAALPESAFDELYPDEKMKEYARSILGSEAPDAALDDLAGQRVSLASFRGGPVVLEFARTTCPYCADVQPVVAEAAKRRPDVAFVQAFPGEAREDVQAFLAAAGAEAPESIVLVGGEAAGIREAFGRYPYVPVFLFIDGDGTIVHVLFGAFDLAAMEAALAHAFP